MEVDGEICLYINTSPDERIEQCSWNSDYSWNGVENGVLHDEDKSSNQKWDKDFNENLIIAENEPYSPTGFDFSSNSESPKESVASSEVDVKDCPLDDEDDEDDLKPSYETRPSSWWWGRFAELASSNEDLDQVAREVYEERKAIYSDEKKNFFYYRQIARELVALLRDEEIPFIWRYSFHKLCTELSQLSKDWDEQLGKGKKFQQLEIPKKRDIEEEDCEIGGKRVKVEKETIVPPKMEMKKEKDSE